MTTPTILFVGESPPAGAPADFTPFDCASGTRLATIMLGLRDRQTMLDHVPRDNIYTRPTGAKGCANAWEPAVAHSLGDSLLQTSDGVTTMVALGRRTAEALGMPDPVKAPAYNWVPPIGATWTFTHETRRPGNPSSVPEYTIPEDEIDTRRVTVIYAPHPSGASSTLNDPTTRAEVRAMLLPEIILGIPTLRPWHFRLEDPATLAAVAAAVSPLCPALGAVALLYADGMHRASEARMKIPLLARMSAATTPRELGEATEQAIRDSQLAPWDEALRSTAATLLGHDGGRALARRWGLSSPLKKDGALVTAARPHAALNRSTSIATMRATLARYAAAGLA